MSSEDECAFADCADNFVLNYSDEGSNSMGSTQSTGEAAPRESGLVRKLHIEQLPGSSTCDKGVDNGVAGGELAVAGASQPTARAARRAPRQPPPCLPPELPASADDVVDLSSLSRVIKLLSTTAIKAVTEGKSVTASNKRLVVALAAETQRAIDVYVRRAPSLAAMATEPTTNASTNSVHVANPSSSVASAPVNPASTSTDELKKELSTCISEVRRLRGDLAAVGSVLSSDARTASYAQAVGRPVNKQVGTRQAPTPVADAVPALPLSSRPALLVTTKTPVGTRQEAVEAFRKTISFRDAKYAPAKVAPLSKNKLRVEFDSHRDCDDAFERIKNSTQALVTAEIAKKLKPMFILKGISTEMPAEDLVGVILGQNTELDGFDSTDLLLKFKRNNRNDKLYNCVFVASPKLFRAVMCMGRLRVDHQRVHVEEFSPFLQCHACLQFGHTNKRCTVDIKPCAHCASVDHSSNSKDCPAQASDSPSAVKCYNCCKNNAKFNLDNNTNHKATSLSCPILRAMKKRTENRIDYGSD